MFDLTALIWTKVLKPDSCQVGVHARQLARHDPITHDDEL
jgi:hypothetical protein